MDDVPPVDEDSLFIDSSVYRAPLPTYQVHALEIFSYYLLITMMTSEHNYVRRVNSATGIPPEMPHGYRAKQTFNTEITLAALEGNFVFQFVLTFYL